MMFTAKVINKMIVGEALQTPDAYLYSGPSHATDMEHRGQDLFVANLCCYLLSKNLIYNLNKNKIDLRLQ